jgi:hypothetical protein
MLAATAVRADLDQEQLIEERLRPKKLVLSVGVSHFRDKLWHDLRFATKDARNLYEALTADSIGFDGGQLLVSSPGQAVDLANIQKSFQRIKDNNRNEDDVIVVYLSTHGTVAYKEDGKIGRYIITSGTDPKNLAKTALDYDQLMSWFHSLKSRKKVLILAFCHSGVGKSVLTPQMKRQLAQLKSPYFEEPIQERAEGSIVLTASGWREPALEDGRLQNDVYTHFLLEGFQRDMNGDGAVSITEAHQYASQKTYQYTKGRQRPSAIMELLGADPVILSGEVETSSKASLYSLMGRFSKLLVAVDGKDMGSLEKGLVVPNGKVRLTLRDPESRDVVADRVVNFEAGREYSVANYLIPRLPNNIFVSAESFYVANRDVRQGYLPGSHSGVKLRYRREEALSIYDAEVGLTWFPERRETIAAGGEQFAQVRRMGILDLQLGTRSRVHSLTAADRSVRTESRLFAGPSLLYVDRDVPVPAFEQKQAQSAVPGLRLTAGLDMILPYHLVKLGFDTNVGFYRNFAQDGPQALSTVSANLSIGTFW